MDKLIKQQLDKVKVADLSNFNTMRNEYIIHQFKQVRFEVNKMYIIKLDTSITNPSPMSTLASNYNGGRVPTNTYYLVDILKVVGKMIKVNGIAYNIDEMKDLDVTWEGWLPIDHIECIKEM